MPVIWTCVPGLVLLPAAVALNIRVARKRPKGHKSAPVVKLEWQLCLRQSAIAASAVEEDARTLFWHWVSTALGFVHILVGILIYSSLMFTMTTDAAVIVVRYLGSVAVCRLILIFELAGMRSTCRLQDQVRDGDDVAMHPLVTRARLSNCGSELQWGKTRDAGETARA